MSEHRSSADEGIWMILCLVALLLLAGGGGFVWLRQRQAQQAMEDELMARQAAEMNLRQAQVAMEREMAARISAEDANAQAARALSQPTAKGQPLAPRLYVNQDLWQHVESLADAGPETLVFTLDAESGEILFGDGEHGAAPPEGPATIQATYETEGGGTVTVSLPAADLKTSRIRAVQNPDGLLRLEVLDPP